MWDKNLIRIWEFFVPLNYELQLKRISVKEVYRSQKKRDCFVPLNYELQIKRISVKEVYRSQKKKKLFLEDFFKFVFKMH